MHGHQKAIKKIRGTSPSSNHKGQQTSLEPLVSLCASSLPRKRQPAHMYTMILQLLVKLLQVEMCTFWSWFLLGLEQFISPSACLWCLILVVTIWSPCSQALKYYCSSGCYFSVCCSEKLISSKVSSNSSVPTNPWPDSPATWCTNLNTSRQHLEQKLDHVALSPELKELLNGLDSNPMMQPIANI